MGVISGTLSLIAVLACTPLARGSLLRPLEHLTEAEVASFLDSRVQPPPRTEGFDELVPQENIRIECIGPRAFHFQSVSLDDGASIGSTIALSQPLVIITHGWMEGANLTQYHQMATRFRRFVPEANCCLLDWQPYATFAFEIAARRGVPLVTEHLSAFLRLLARLYYYPLANVSLVGFSLGGQIAGLTGKALRGRIGAIFALDPAGPLFTTPRDVGPSRRLTRTDARYVQVIATTRYLLGVGPLVGTQNFLPNGGYHPQRGCASLTVTGGELLGIRCSHTYALELFTATLDPAHVIQAQRCLDVCPNLYWPRAAYCHDRVGFHAHRIPGNFCPMIDLL